MSRTDHHDPWRRRASDPANQVNGLAYFHHSHVESPYCGKYCGWSLSHATLMSTPRWFVRCLWSGPERQREREGLRALAGEYNAYGDLTDGDFASWQHRHSASWLYW